MLDHQRRIRFFCYILPTILIFALHLSGENQEVLAQGPGDLNMTAHAGFNGYCKENRWIPVRVTVENKGADLNARIQVAYQNNDGGLSAYGIDISLPTTSRKEFFLYLYPQGYLGKLNVSLIVADRALVTIPLSVTCISNENLVIGLLADDPSAYGSLNETTPLNGFTHVAQLQLADLPDRSQGWEGLDALVVSGMDMGTITDKQREALNAWLAQGGKLLVIGGLKWQSVAGGLNEFLPIDLNTTETLNGLPELQNYFKSPASLTGPAVLAIGQNRPNAEVLVAQDGIPVLIQKQVGFGAVYYLAADPGLQPLSSWGGMKDVYSYLLGTRSLHPSWADAAWDTNYSNQALSALPGLGLPSTYYIIGWLGLYILVIGPLNYLLLRRIKRQELAWISIPALVILFTTVAYFSGTLIRGTRPILNRLAVLQMWDGVTQAQARALVGIYSPNRTKYMLQAGNSFVAYPFDSTNQILQANKDWLSLQQGPDTLLPDVLVESGGMKAVSLSGSLPAIKLTHNLVISLGNDDPVLSGTITNASKYNLRGAILVTPDDSKSLGDFAPGTTKRVQVSLTTNPAGSDFYNSQSQSLYSNYPDTSPDDKTVRRSALMRAILPARYAQDKGNSGVYLIGWVDEALLPASLQGQGFESFDTTLYILKLEPTFTLKPGPLKLSSGLFIWESSNPDLSPYSPYMQNIPAGGYILSFRLATPLHYSAVKSLTLSLNTSSPNEISAFLWDWQRAQWVQLQKLTTGDTNIPNPSVYVGPGAEIRLKIDQGNGNQNQYEIASSYFTLVVEP